MAAPSSPHGPRSLVLLPIGSTEAHGPHLPVETDTHLAVQLARVVARRWTEKSEAPATVVPPMVETACLFAADLPGTVHVPPHEERRALLAAIEEARRLPDAIVTLVNLHFDPAHMAVLREAIQGLHAAGADWVRFCDFTRRAHAARVGGEFSTGACHGGEFETSLMLVAAPKLVNPSHRNLPARMVDLAAAIKAGCRSFRELGLTQGYCGRPASATAAEGRRLYDVLARIILDDVVGRPGQET